MAWYDELIETGVDSVTGLGEHLTDTEKLGQIGLSPENYNVISAMNAADNMNAGVGSLMGPGALYTLGDTLTNPNQGFMEGISDFGRYMKGANIQNNPELAKQLMGENYVNQMQGKYALAMDEIGKGIFGKGPNPDLYNRQTEPMGIEDFLGTSTPQNLGFIDDAPQIKEAIYQDRIMNPNLPGLSYQPKQNWFDRIMSGAQNKLGGAWGKTKELGTRFKEGAKPILGLASMIGNATSPLNPKSFNYNPDLAAQLNFMDQNYAGSMVNNPSSGLLQYAQGTPLAGQNVMSVFGSNDPVKQLEKQLARRQKTYDNLENQWGDTLTAEQLEAKKQNYFDKFLNPTTSWLGKVKADQKVRIDKKNKALELKELQKEARKKKLKTTGWNEPSQDAGGGQGWSNPQTPGINWGQTHSGPVSNKTGRGRKGWARGGRVGYANGGLASLFTRRG